MLVILVGLTPGPDPGHVPGHVNTEGVPVLAATLPTRILVQGVQARADPGAAVVAGPRCCKSSYSHWPSLLTSVHSG